MLTNLLEESRRNVRHRHNGNAADFYDEFAVGTNFLDVAFGTLVEAVNYPDMLAAFEVGHAFAQVLDASATIRGGEDDEAAHLHIVDGCGLLRGKVLVVHQVAIVQLFVSAEERGRGAEKKQRVHERFVDVGQHAVFELLDGGHRHIGGDAFRIEVGLDVHQATVEYLQRIPAHFFLGHGHKFHSCTLEKRAAATIRQDYFPRVPFLPTSIGGVREPTDFCSRAQHQKS